MTELLSDPKHIRGDLAIIHRSLLNQWKLPETLLSGLPQSMIKIVVDENAKPRERIAAARNLMLMKAANDMAENPQPVPQTTVNVGVKIDTANPGVGRTLAAQIVERIRAARISGNSAG